MDRTAFEQLTDQDRRTRGLQVTDDLFLVSPHADDPTDLMNHSCEPNLGVLGTNALVAMRHIETGESLCFDYAMTESSTYDEFECVCGRSACRGRIMGDDWRDPVLQQRYHGYFSAYLQKRIDQLRR